MFKFIHAFGWQRKLPLQARVNADDTKFSAVSSLRLRCLALSLLAAACIPAQAADYIFPGNLPATCRNSGGSYTCDELTLAPDETINVVAGTRIIVSGTFTAGSNARINYGGLASDLHIDVLGKTDVGSSSDITAILTSVGVVTIGAFGRFTGDIKTQYAAINIGDLSTIDGSLSTTVSGVVNVGAQSRVTGSISTLSGAVNIGANSRIDGPVTSRLAGVITVGAGTVIGGNVVTGSGAINLGERSNVVGFLLSTLAGAITVGDNAVVGGGIGTKSGAITIGAGSSSGGSVCTALAGAVTLNNKAEVVGNIRTHNGAITVGDLSKVKGDVNAATGAVTIAPSAKVGAVASNIACVLDAYEASHTTLSVPVIKSREWRQIFMR